ncbi:four helix bundle protein [Dyella sp.]|uniref:four helix bundle protein n=1 Tax=Dyella sp. TaxID=1869338 RepID=UPI002FDB867F
MTFNLPPAVRLAEGLARDIEQAAARFQRAHRYTFGAELRKHAWNVLTTANRAARKPAQRSALLEQLVDQVDDLKLAIQQGQNLRLFSSFGQFSELMRNAIQLGQQVGGWHKQIHPKGQNGYAHARGQRAKTLSTQDTSKCEVNS